MTIRTRLTLIYSAVLVAVIALLAVAFFSLFDWAWREQIAESMNIVAQQVSQIVLNEVMDSEPPAAIYRRLARSLNLSFAVQVWQHDGKLLFATDNLAYSQPFDADNRDSRVKALRDVNLASEDLHALVFTQPIYTPQAEYLGTVQVLSPLTILDAAKQRLMRVIVFTAIVTLVVSSLIGFAVASHFLHPIETIAQAAKQITAANDLSKRIPYKNSDELGQLALTFNTTLDRLERLFMAQRRFVADVSHEMRTPLTTLQGNLDLIKRYGIEAASLEAMESELKRMNRLVGDLLLLAQADSGHLPLREDQVDLDTLVMEVFRQAKLLSQTIEVRLVELQAARVKGDSDRLKQVLLNLVTNAIKYTPENGAVMLSLTVEGGYAVLRVSDTGIGIPKEDLPHIFERFYRVDKARDRKIGGAGLGLSIAKWIVEAHHGRISVESELGKGSTFTVQLPCLNADVQPESLRDTQPRIPILQIGKRKR
ncbi:MAG: hypothetical protein CUN49_06870 [Candidatus Thermofonsia Clade 1 bacterium]|jgi:heavy metal sensor kinase|uniref:histidine kinase n=1 Tax=Candidatus Thermofonsia Clade 1 bacterium TaxID=2364210 RepID=A0A2M8PF85_9CHLR|nr:MAG: hypothetical protein CUN49_06870 [Candidatus Thermofonsia Clade 1 bacterium]RMF51096.1 MAG: HAMP domain-containing protein [Chloroflexota bacterium]